MTADVLREILHRQPFEPVRVVMSSGEYYDVLHPEMCLVMSKHMVIAIPDSSRESGDRMAFCSYLHVAHVEVLKATRAA